MKGRTKTALTKAAKGQSCTLQIYPYCNGNPETVVGCHINSELKGIGFKSPDWWLVHGCSDCHDVIDGRRKTDLSKLEIQSCIMRGLFRTLQRLFDQEVIKLNEAA